MATPGGRVSRGRLVFGGGRLCARFVLRRFRSRLIVRLDCGGLLFSGYGRYGFGLRGERSRDGSAREPAGQSENQELLETQSNHFFFFARRRERQNLNPSG